MDQDQCYRVNGPDVVHETIDGEVVVVNLKNGTYYSTEHSGTDIWSGIERGLSLKNIICALKSRYSGPPDEIEAGVELMLSQLLQEKLIVACEQPSDAAGSEWLAATQVTRFEAPVIQKYTDMEELLALDPIHEVGDAGWPQPAG
jgi:hypothetical protein